MKGNRKRRRQQTIPVWSYEQARQAVPYLNSIMTSVRDARLEALQQDRLADRLAKQPGRPDRRALIAEEEARRNSQRADQRFHEALQELHDLGIYCLDPVRGEALVPFAHEQQLAWFVFDLFDEEPYRFWRYHNDALEMRRPIAEVRHGSSGNTLVV